MAAFYEAAEETLPHWMPGMRLTGISSGVLQTVARSDWRDHAEREVKHWDWWKWHSYFREDSGRFECALHYNSLLVGLVLGTCSRASADEPPKVEVWYLEGRPGNHPLKGLVAFFLTECAYYFGITMGASEVRIVNPLADVLRVYQDLGFETVRDGANVLYCSKPIPG